MEDRASKAKGLAWVAGACLLGAACAFGLSPLAHAIPWSWEKKLGYALDTDFITQECHAGPQAQALLQQVVQRLYPAMPHDGRFSIAVRVVKNPQVNAYAELGGRITVYSGLLKQAESADELAGVLAHEMGHVQHRHILEGTIAHLFTAQGMHMLFGYSSVADWSGYFLNMDFSRTQEAQADEAGLKRLQAAHIDNQGFQHFFERMQESSSPAFLSDHPSNQARIAMVQEFDNRNTRSIMAPQEWKVLQQYCAP